MVAHCINHFKQLSTQTLFIELGALVTQRKRAKNSVFIRTVTHPLLGQRTPNLMYVLWVLVVPRIHREHAGNAVVTNPRTRCHALIPTGYPFPKCFNELTRWFRRGAK